MGIKGLWKELQPACRAAHVSQFRGQRVGVDTYCWLHRAIISCTMELATDKPCDQYLSFIMGRVDMLLRFGVTPVLVFDGDSMPMKRVTDQERRARRSQALADAKLLLAQGSVEDAVRMFEKSLDVSKELAHSVMLAAMDRGVECIVAPYEADAQLAFLAREGHVQAVISEDSDLLVYNCPVLLAKMDHNGNCDAVKSRDVQHVLGLGGARSLPYESLVMSCIVSGCDYLPSLPGIGVKTAFKVVSAAKSVPDLMNTFATSHGFTARELQPYEQSLHQAFYCFAHHLVYDPATRKVVCFTPLPDKVPHRAELVGALWDDHTAEMVCRACQWDPTTRLPYTGKHQPCLDLYFAKTKKGQQRLTNFSGFERMKAARVVLARRDQEAHAAAMFGPPITKPFELSRFVGGPVGGGPQSGDGSSGRQKLVLLRSKYFAAEGDSEGGDEPALLSTDAASMPRSSASPLLPEPPTGAEPAAAALHNKSSPSVGEDEECLLPDTPSQQVRGGPHAGPPLAVITNDNSNSSCRGGLRGWCSPPLQEASQGASPPSADSQPLPRGDVLCPHGNVRCGKIHSVLLRCVEEPISSWPAVIGTDAAENRRPAATCSKPTDWSMSCEPAEAVLPQQRRVGVADEEEVSVAPPAPVGPPPRAVLPFKRPREMVAILAEKVGAAQPQQQPQPVKALLGEEGTAGSASVEPKTTAASSSSTSAGCSDSTRRALDVMNALRMPSAAGVAGLSRRAIGSAAGGPPASGLRPITAPSGGAAAAKELFERLACIPRR